MARSINEIYKEIVAEKDKRLELSEYKSDSKVSVINGIAWFVSAAIYSFETIMDTFIVDINDIIKNTAATFEGICTSRQIRLELLLSGHELYVRADMEQIQQVLYNLLDNAIKFSNDNSSVQIETTVKSGKVFVSVKDYGTGIPKESLGKIWDRFYKIDASRGKDRKGTGLGLSIVKEIINAHNQNIDVISTEGVGTEFIFTLEKTK